MQRRVLTLRSPCFHSFLSRFSVTPLHCVACYLSEALIAEGSAAAACDVLRAAVERAGGPAAADGDLKVTQACALAVAGARAAFKQLSSAANARAAARFILPRKRGLGSGFRRGSAGLRVAVPRVHCAEV